MPRPSVVTMPTGKSRGSIGIMPPDSERMKLTVVEASEQGKTSYSLSGLTPFHGDTYGERGLVTGSGKCHRCKVNVYVSNVDGLTPSKGLRVCNFACLTRHPCSS
jgi:hypothetical protein